MASQWYYGAGDNRQGPFTDQQLRDLAVDGRIQPTDTIWKEGVEQGIPAHRVKNLLPPGATPMAPPPEAPFAPPPSLDASPEAARAPLPSTAEYTPLAEEPEEQAEAEPGAEAEAAAEEPAEAKAPEQPAEATKPRPPSGPSRKPKAVAIRGAIIVSQDGETVIFNKKCIKCGQAETGRSRLPIRMGMTRASYFCRKCKKVRPVEIQGMP